nr:uncharacterized protein LOC117843854 [Setaria viridis]
MYGLILRLVGLLLVAYFLCSMDPMHILIWNVRGLNSLARRDAVRVIVDSSKIDIICLQETKMNSVSREIILSMLGSDFDNNYIFLPSVGASGGILVAWRSRLGAVGASRIDSHCASVQFCSPNGTAWWLTCVYGPQDNQAKVQFLQELRDLRVQCTIPWMVAGDFNLIYKDEDKNNTNLNRAMMGRFRRWINDMAVTEVPLHGRKFTWSSSSTSADPTLVKLDRVFCSPDWEDMFPECLLQSAASDDSDHCPLILGLTDNLAGKRRFHFESFWPGMDGFTEAVETAWNSVQPRHCPVETLSLKLKATARGLQSWSQKKIGHINSQLFLAKEIIHQFGIAQESRTLQPNELWRRNNLKKHALALASLLRTVARLRSRVGWLKEGDANTRLFHMHARHRKKNFIAKLRVDDRTITTHEEKAAEILEFYSNLIGTDCTWDRTIDLTGLNIPGYNLEALDIPFTEEEVWNTIKQLPSDKASGPDGFTGRFYKSCWSVIKDDMMAAVHTVWGKFFRNLWMLNSAYITLMPKRSDAEQVKDFIPISLVHSFAKLVTKILANRLASRLDEMVSCNQKSAFIKKRFIQDNYMLVQQTVRFLYSQKQLRILLKLDITKAFDSVSRSFLMEVIRKLGFGSR